MKYLFILGRNLELSIAEIKAFFEREKNEIFSYSLKDNAMLIELKFPLKNKVINKFGGIIAIGEILAFGDNKNIINEIDKKTIYFGEKNKINYVLWNFSSNVGKIGEYLKLRFKKEKLKATSKNIGDKLILQSGKSVQNLSSHKLIDEEYFLFEEKDKFYFGRIIENSEYKDIEERDMNKPVRRSELSISPRLAKIIINLSKVKENELLVDCFCGIGVILQEALIQNIKVIGIDNDKNAVDGARQNLGWFNFPKENYKLINIDSRKVKIEKANVIVSEPDLGEILKKIPTKEEAEKILRNYENLMINVLNNLKNNVSGRIVFTSPLINISTKRVSCDIEKIIDKTGLKLVKGFPISEFRKEQIVGRNIFVLEY